jgi:hypothetical protein
VAYLIVLSQQSLIEADEYHRATKWKADSLIEIRNMYLQSVKSHRCFNLLAMDRPDLRRSVKEGCHE